HERDMHRRSTGLTVVTAKLQPASRCGVTRSTCVTLLGTTWPFRGTGSTNLGPSCAPMTPTTVLARFSGLPQPLSKRISELALSRRSFDASALDLAVPNRPRGREAARRHTADARGLRHVCTPS